MSDKFLTSDDNGYEEMYSNKHLPEDWEECGGCRALVNFSKLEYGEITSHYESRGEFWGAPCSENVVDVFICPNCGKHNEL